MSDAVPKLKLMVVGDAKVGKTAMLMAHANKSFPQAEVILGMLVPSSHAWVSRRHQIPRVSDTVTAGPVLVDDQQYMLEVWDSAGADDYDNIRYMSYPQSSVFIVCFDINDPISFESVHSRWMREVRHPRVHADIPVPYILCGLKPSLREDSSRLEELAAKKMKPVTKEHGESMCAQIGAKLYMEVDALTNPEQIGNLLLEAAKVANKPPPAKRSCCIM